MDNMTFSGFIQEIMKLSGVRRRKKYSRPYTANEIRENYPEKADVLLMDPVHKWRAKPI